MALKVFISHSTIDMDIIYELHRWLLSEGLEAYVAEFYPMPGIPVPSKVAGAIDSCDCFIALLTADGNRSEFVQQEIGYALRAGKFVVPIVEEGVVKPGGFLEDVDYIPFNRYDPVDAISSVVYFLKERAVRKDEEERNKTILGMAAFALGLMGLAAAASSSKRKKE
jgi:hypothetical protein